MGVTPYSFNLFLERDWVANDGLAFIVDELQEKTGLDIPIHVDAASGGFVAPFAYPDFKWAFDVPRVVSINTSGHKFGLVYPGLGWILWRDEKFLHKDLVFELRKQLYQSGFL